MCSKPFGRPVCGRPNRLRRRLVLILKDYHDALDEAVARAYGWPAGLGEDEILNRLVALNRERAREEQRGKIAWLRPDYQIPAAGLPADKPEQLEAVLDVGETREQKPHFPPDDRGQTGLVMAILAAAPGPLTAAEIAARFRKGRRVAQKVAAALTALVRMGVVSTDDGGQSFAMRRVA